LFLLKSIIWVMIKLVWGWKGLSVRLCYLYQRVYPLIGGWPIIWYTPPP
jgi:hypothetical protein